MSRDVQGRLTGLAPQRRRDVLQAIGLVAIGSGVAGATTGSLQAELQVEITDAPSQVLAGESATVTARVTNLTDSQQTTNARVNFEGDSRDLTLGPGQSTTVTLEFSTNSRDAGNQLLQVSCGNATGGTRIDVLAPPFYEVAMRETNAPVLEGETLSFTAEVTNTGDASGGQRIRYKVEETGPFGELIGEGGTSQSVGGGSTSTVSFSTPVPEGGRRELVITVSSDNTTASRRVQVRKAVEPTFEVAITDSATITQGDPFEATVDIENTGDSGATKLVELELGTVGVASREVQLGAGGSTTETFSIPTERGSAGTHTLTARTEDDTDSRSVRIGAEPLFEVSLAGYSTPVPAGDDLTINVEVDNTGGASGDDTIEVGAGDIGSTSIDVSLDSGESTSESVSFSTGSVDPGTYPITVESSHDSVSDEVTVESPDDSEEGGTDSASDGGQFDVLSIGINQKVVAGSEFPVIVELRNEGESPANETLVVEGEGFDTASTDIQLDPGQSVIESVTLSTSSGDAGEQTLNASTRNASLSTNITVLDADEGSDGDGDGNGSDGDDENNSVVEESDDSGPGFGVGTALVSLGGAGYLLRRRLGDDEP